MSTDYVPPTQDEIQRVAEHWQRVKDLSCTHGEIEFHGPGNPPICADCGRPVQFLSDLQIEELKR